VHSPLLTLKAAAYSLLTALAHARSRDMQVLGVVAEFIATGLGGLGLWDELQVACVECAACACLE
jgi:hypothetical protein